MSEVLVDFSGSSFNIRHDATIDWNELGLIEDGVDNSKIYFKMTVGRIINTPKLIEISSINKQKNLIFLKSCLHRKASKRILSNFNNFKLFINSYEL